MGRTHCRASRQWHPKPGGYVIKAWRTLFGNLEGEKLFQTLKFTFEKLGRGSRQKDIRIFYRNRRERVVRAWKILFGHNTMEKILHKIQQWNKQGFPIPTVETA